MGSNYYSSGTPIKMEEEFKFKEELNKLFVKNKDKWRTFGEPYVAVGILFDEFIRLLKETRTCNCGCCKRNRLVIDKHLG